MNKPSADMQFRLALAARDRVLKAQTTKDRK